MKLCAYCGKENEDAATLCAECGTDMFKDAAGATMATSNAKTPPQQLRDILADPMKLFRALIILSNGAYVLSMLVAYCEWRYLSNDIMGLLDYHGYGAILPLPIGITWLTVAVFLAVALGLYNFSASARAAFTILTVGFGVFSLFSGVSVASPLVGLLAWVMMTADGAILVLAYATPLKEKFV